MICRKSVLKDKELKKNGRMQPDVFQEEEQTRNRHIYVILKLNFLYDFYFIIFFI